MVSLPQPNLKQNFGMTDIPNFVTFDNSTIAPSLLPTVSSMSVSAGTPSDTVSKANPMPEPTNSIYTMGGGDDCQHSSRNCAGVMAGYGIGGNSTMGLRPRPGEPTMGLIDMPGMMGLSTPSSRRKIQNAEWKKPSYNYQRTKRAEGTNGTTAGVMAGLALFGFGLWGISQLIETDFDDSGLLTGSSSTTP